MDSLGNEMNPVTRDGQSSAGKTKSVLSRMLAKPSSVYLVVEVVHYEASSRKCSRSLMDFEL
jgi:hypothetical protein